MQSEVLIEELGICLRSNLSLEHIIIRKRILHGLPETARAFQLIRAYCTNVGMRISPCIMIYEWAYIAMYRGT
jgi:hypothetical protein